MKSLFAFPIFVQLAATWVSASPIAPGLGRSFIPFVDYPSKEADKAPRSPIQHEHLPFVHYPGSEEFVLGCLCKIILFINCDSANNVRRSPLDYIPFIHYPSDDAENEETDEKGSQTMNEAREIFYHPCGRDTAHNECKPFVRYPGEE
ncbi:hypothetical protein K438DRAFT_90773 [Mycena galopus ATCC 62051]|nr:hypothetical protein K438DRAFT_90773 [Mycena galopus ATCC 62051]